MAGYVMEAMQHEFEQFGIAGLGAEDMAADDEPFALMNLEHADPKRSLVED